MSTTAEQVQRAVERYQRSRQEVEDAYQQRDWYPEYGRDYEREVRECQRSLGAEVANIYGSTVPATARATPTPEEES